MSKQLGQVQAAVEDFAEYAELVLGRSPNTVKGYVADLKGLAGYADTFDAFTLDALRRWLAALLLVVMIAIGLALGVTMALAVSIFPVISLVTPLFRIWSAIGLYDTWAGLSGSVWTADPEAA